MAEFNEQTAINKVTDLMRKTLGTNPLLNWQTQVLTVEKEYISLGVKITNKTNDNGAYLEFELSEDMRFHGSRTTGKSQ